jgi:hypothetical protein
MGKPAKNSAKGLYETEAQNAPFFIGKLEGRELLFGQENRAREEKEERGGIRPAGSLSHGLTS